MQKITCKINNKKYQLYPLVSKKQKKLGLKLLPDIRKDEGVLFVYTSDIGYGFDFSEIPYSCKIYFMSSDLNILHSEKTVSFQKDIVRCPNKFRYVIEIPE